ncbi:chitinase [Drepanopeziza brunnea f. sp. 'multigermtubi' MB_m1]|uniref:chitinase n=1 Tax=Marssonina brunnea f. sp. multigermtubi (strain MB_m1) TaxID=1072389 RepID=K1XAQ1_MARBU|nr:chitinase [Drepanopeziza brunnea f. sp. 'multigermtubi' MB_m1]EKD17798.1 chitinase [Drepanopeziza brunnea f. sp. 'multigermtubi' MB_m1]
MHCSTLFSLLSLCAGAFASPSVVSHGPYQRNAHRNIHRRGNYREHYKTSPKPSDGMRAVGYFGNWVRLFDTSKSLVVDTRYLSDEWADIQKTYDGDVASNSTDLFGSLKQLYLLKKKNRSLKTLLAIAGATYSVNMSPVLRSPKLRAKFVTSSIKLMTDLGFDGLDMDYEYVANATEAVDMVTLLGDLRAAMDAIPTNTTSDASPFLLTYASPAGPNKYKLLDFKGMDQYLDFWNYMGFDYAGAWDKISGHMSNVYEDESNKAATPFNTTSAIDYYIANGATPHKINLGSPLYARAFANTAGPGTPFNGTGAASSFGEAGIFDTKHLPLAGSNATVTNMREVGAAYSYDAGRRYMLSFDTPTVARVKAEYVIEKGLGGMMWWEVSMDRKGPESLVRTTVESFGGVGALEGSRNRLAYPMSRFENLRRGMPGQ